MHRKDRSSASPLHRGGVAVQIHTMFHVLVQFEIHTIFENTAIIVQHRANPQMKLLLITLYNKPSNKFADFIADLNRRGTVEMNELLMLSLLMWMWSSAPPALCVTLL
jgi:hypothetical protein